MFTLGEFRISERVKRKGRQAVERLREWLVTVAGQQEQCCGDWNTVRNGLGALHVCSSCHSWRLSLQLPGKITLAVEYSDQCSDD